MNLESVKMVVLGTVKMERILEIMATDVDGLGWVDRVLMDLLNGKKRYVDIVYFSSAAPFYIMSWHGMPSDIVKCLYFNQKGTSLHVWVCQAHFLNHSVCLCRFSSCFSVDMQNRL